MTRAVHTSRVWLSVGEPTNTYTHTHTHTHAKLSAVLVLVTLAVTSSFACPGLGLGDSQDLSEIEIFTDSDNA